LYKGEVIITISELKKLLGIENKYSDWRDLRKAVIEPSIAEINDKTFLHLEYEPIKQGKKIIELRIKVNEAVGYQTSWLDEEEEDKK
jgi:plasmid replication initiation protein